MDAAGATVYLQAMALTRWKEVAEHEPASPTSTVAAPRSAPPVFSATPPADPGVAADGAIALARELGLSITVADVLHRAGRGADETTRRSSTRGSPPHAARVDGRPRGQRGAHRPRGARRERIAVFGDYDCDGITAPRS